ncbi:unnamed protein product [Oikopleura dioica]|uniref:ZP domain-containing protein n=1 Tax=Oikopleura dioica TaxID=34765 RepID=E4YGV7_OIKDI|nr:unnamed protein product [Oikopleura dioica]
MKICLFGISLCLAELNCSVNNGGCSHKCSPAGCSCPSCWSLVKDNLTCLPSPGLAQVTCSASGISLQVDECVLGGRADPTFLDSSCTSEINDEGLVEISTDLSNCGTIMEFLDSDDLLKFSNRLVAPSAVRNGRIVSRPLIMNFECLYSTRYENITTNYSADMNSVAVTFDMATYDVPVAALGFGLDFFTDSTFGTKLTEENMQGGIFVGNTLHAAVNSHIFIEDLTFTIERCEIEDPSTGVSLRIIDDRCPLAELGVEIFKKHDQRSIPFSFQAFLFPGQENTGIYDVKCHLLGTGFRD